MVEYCNHQDQRFCNKTDSDQSVTDGQSAKVTFNNSVFDIGSNFGSDKFTAPVTGIYHFDVSVRVNRQLIMQVL